MISPGQVRTIAGEANDVPLRHSGEGLSGRKYRMYLGYRLKQFLRPRTTGENFQPHMSFNAVPINTDKEIEKISFLSLGQ